MFFPAPDLASVLPGLARHKSIWHYTSAEAALSIIETKRVRLGQVEMLNDSGELNHGLSLIRARLEDARFTLDHWDEVDGVVSSATDEDLGQLYVACASSLPSSLSQYRSYGPYALGIDPEVHLQLTGTAHSSDPFADFVTPGDELTNATLTYGWRRVLYSSDDKNQLVSNLLESLSQQMRDAPHRNPADADDTGEDEMVASYFAVSCVVAAAAFLKHEAFAEEAEVRLLAVCDLMNPAVGFRAGRLGLTPFIEVEAKYADNTQPVSILSSVRLGPLTGDSEAAMSGLRMALRKFAPGVTAVGADIAYR